MANLLALWLMVAGLMQPVIGQIKMSDELEPFEPIVAVCEVPAPTGSNVDITWRSDSKTKFEMAGNNAKLHAWAPPGEHWVEATAIVQVFQEIVVWVPNPEFPKDINKAELKTLKILLSSKVDRFEHRFTVKGKVTDPDTPVNPLDPSPLLPLQGMRVLILEESSPSANLPRTQSLALRSLTLRAYLDSKAPGRWRKFDPHSALTNLPLEWQDQRSKATTTGNSPWVVISGVVGGVEKVMFQGPFPLTEEEALTLFKKYGG